MGAPRPHRAEGAIIYFISDLDRIGPVSICNGPGKRRWKTPRAPDVGRRARVAGMCTLLCTFGEIGGMILDENLN
jgi:hypothetical protein